MDGTWNSTTLSDPVGQAEITGDRWSSKYPGPQIFMDNYQHLELDLEAHLVNFSRKKENLTTRTEPQDTNFTQSIHPHHLFFPAN